MSGITATTELLRKLKALYPAPLSGISTADVLQNPWWILVASVFSTGNAPESVPVLFQFVLAELEDAQTELGVEQDKAHEERLLLARKFRDTLFKSGMFSGYSKAINALKALYDVTPEDLCDRETLRDKNVSIEEYERIGLDFFRTLNGDNTEMIKSMLDSVFPDLGWFGIVIAYGCVYGFLEYTNQLETSYAIVGTLVAADTPLQINWHLQNARRGGASAAQAKAAREIAVETARAVGVTWLNAIPEVTD